MELFTSSKVSELSKSSCWFCGDNTVSIDGSPSCGMCHSCFLNKYYYPRINKNKNNNKKINNKQFTYISSIKPSSIKLSS